MTARSIEGCLASSESSVKPSMTGMLMSERITPHSITSWARTRRLAGRGRAQGWRIRSKRRRPRRGAGPGDGTGGDRRLAPPHENDFPCRKAPRCPRRVAPAAATLDVVVRRVQLFQECGGGEGVERSGRSFEPELRPDRRERPYQVVEVLFGMQRRRRNAQALGAARHGRIVDRLQVDPIIAEQHVADLLA